MRFLYNMVPTPRFLSSTMLTSVKGLKLKNSTASLYINSYHSYLYSLFRDPVVTQELFYFKIARIKLIINSLSFGSDAAISIVSVASVSSDNLFHPLMYKLLFLPMK